MFKKLYYPKRLRDRLNPQPEFKKRPAPVNALLWIDDTAYRLLEVSYGFTRHVDGAGRIIGDLCVTPIKAIIKPIKDHGSVALLAYASKRRFHGKIQHFHLDGINKIQKDTIIYNAYITSYEGTNSYYEPPFERVEVLTISPLYLKVNDTVYESSMNPNRPMEMNPPGLLSRADFEKEKKIEKKTIPKVTAVEGPFDDQGNPVDYIEKEKKYIYYATLADTTADLSQVHWAVTYDDEGIDKSYKLFSGGRIANGKLKVHIRTHKAKERFKIYAYTGDLPKKEMFTEVKYKDVSEVIFSGTKQWGGFQQGMPTQNRRLTAEELDARLDFVGVTKVALLKEMNQGEVKLLYERGPFGVRTVLSDDDDIEQKVIQNFYTGALSKLSFDENSSLSKKLKTQDSFQEYFGEYLKVIGKLVEDEELKNINGTELGNKFPSRPFPNFSNVTEIADYDTYGLMGGTQQITVELEVIHHTVVEGKAVDYHTIKTKMCIGDWYGADWDDINGWDSKIKGNVYSLNAFFWLQHYYGCHPFETEIIYKSEDRIEIK